MSDILELHRQALLACTGMVEQVHPTSLGAPTPCAEWTLGELIQHMIALNVGFAAAAAGRGVDPSVWRTVPLASGFVQQWAASAASVRAGFQLGTLDRPVVVPVVASRPVTATVAVAAHAVDLVVHAWDIGASIGAEVPLSPEVLDAVARRAALIPDDESRTEPGAAFAPSVTVGVGGTTWDRLVASLGRDPNWSPSRSSAS